MELEIRNVLELAAQAAQRRPCPRRVRPTAVTQVLPAWGRLLVDHNIAEEARALEVYAALGTSFYSAEDVALLWPMGPYAANILVGAPLDSEDNQLYLG